MQVGWESRRYPPNEARPKSGAAVIALRSLVILEVTWLKVGERVVLNALELPQTREETAETRVGVNALHPHAGCCCEMQCNVPRPQMRW